MIASSASPCGVSLPETATTGTPMLSLGPNPPLSLVPVVPLAPTEALSGVLRAPMALVVPPALVALTAPVVPTVAPGLTKHAV